MATIDSVGVPWGDGGVCSTSSLKQCVSRAPENPSARKKAMDLDQSKPSVLRSTQTRPPSNETKTTNKHSHTTLPASTTTKATANGDNKSTYESNTHSDGGSLSELVESIKTALNVSDESSNGISTTVASPRTVDATTKSGVPTIICVHPSTGASLSPTKPFEHIPPMRTARSLPKTQSLDIVDEDTEEMSCSHAAPSRPIYPNVPYSPYGSPFGSPRGRKRQPFRESRRVSIENVGTFLQLNQYKLFDKIGQGSYGLVKLAYCEEESTHYAMKILSKKKILRKAGLMARGPKRGAATSPLDRVYREIAVLKKLDHPNVVKLIEVLDDPQEDSLYMVFELVELGAVLTIPTQSPLTEERTWSVFRDTVLGLEYLHYQRIIHSDIKPDNLLLSENGRVKIADLGVCNEFHGDDASMSNISTPGTPAFRAPETLLIGQHSYSGKAVDVWALGVTLFALVYGRVPFAADNVPVLYDRIRKDALQFPSTAGDLGNCISDGLQQLIVRMLDKDPATRITLPQIKLHRWVTSNDTCPLPTEEENCLLVDVTDDDISTVVTSIPKLDTLILIKNMLKKHSFQNPFARKSAVGQTRTERFLRAGRSNSAPGAYHGIDRQVSSESLLAPVSEVLAASSETSFTEEDEE